MLLGRNLSSELVWGTYFSPHSQSVYGVEDGVVGDCAGSWESESLWDCLEKAAVDRASFAHET